MKTEVVEEKSENLGLKRTIAYAVLLVLVMGSAIMVVLQ